MSADSSTNAAVSRNPFRPTFGVPPLYWVGRAAILDSFHVALEEGPGAFGRSMIISGTRGIGKTVLLTELEEQAAPLGWITLRASGRGNLVDTLVETTVPRAIDTLEPKATTRVDRVSIGGLGTVGVHHDTEPTFKPNLNTRLRELLALTRDSGVFLTIDEVQDASPEDLTELAVTYQDLLRDELNIALVMAGLPQGVDALLDMPGATFLRRAQRHILGPFSAANAAVAFNSTAKDSGCEFASDATDAAIALSHGYPFLVQLVGSLAWRTAVSRGSSRIEPRDIASIAPTVVSTMGVQVHAPALKELTPTLRSVLETMATIMTETGTDTCEIASIAQRMGRTTKSLSDARQRLINADLIESAGFGTLRFTLPYLAEYLAATDAHDRVD